MKYVFQGARLTGTVTVGPDGVTFSGEIDDMRDDPRVVYALPWMPPLTVATPEAPVE